eukprot:gene16522-19535_t
MRRLSPKPPSSWHGKPETEKTSRGDLRPPGGSETTPHMPQTFPSPDIQIDARGHRCPVPTLRLRRALEAAEPGAIIHLLADDPLARIDVPHFVAQTGQKLLDSGDGETGLWFRV